MANLILLQFPPEQIDFFINPVNFLDCQPLAGRQLAALVKGEVA